MINNDLSKTIHKKYYKRLLGRIEYRLKVHRFTVQLNELMEAII
jgi:hypothetical protein